MSALRLMLAKPIVGDALFGAGRGDRRGVDGRLAADLHQRVVGRRPAHHPARLLGDVVRRQAGSHQVEHRPLGERRIGRRREVEDEDEEQRPGHRNARLAHRRRGEVAHQDVRQRSRADHQAEDEQEEVERVVAAMRERRDVADGDALSRSPAR